jgi:4-hydroxy-tetrahydrodipicolinate synthase
MKEEKYICRCEEVTETEIREAIRAGARSVIEIKRWTRAGMGICQGRSCRRLVERILAEELNLRPEEVEVSSFRPPVRPVSIQAMEIKEDLMDFGRLMVAMATPLKENLELDIQKAVALAKRLVGEGVDGLVLSGTTGESPTLSRQEKIDLIVEVKKAVRVPIIGNAGTNDTKASIQNALDAEAAGADGLLLVAPYYNKPDQGMLYDHFAAIAGAVKIPSMLYNVPGRTAITIKPETIVKLSRDVPQICMLKDAAGVLDDTTVVIRDAAPGFRVYTGEDALTLPTLAIGGYGVVSVAGHVVAPFMKKMIEAHLAGKVAEAASLHVRLQAINRALFLQPNPVPVKMALKLLGFDVGPLRPPLKDASAEVTAALSKALADLGLIK